MKITRYMTLTFVLIGVCLLLSTSVSARFISIDPAASKYPDWSPYNYCKDNPLKYIDPDGRELELTGSQADIDQTVQIANDAMGPTGTATVDAAGIVTVTPDNSFVGPPTPEQQAMFNTMSASADPSTPTTSIGVTNGSNAVLVGSYNLQQIDVADIQPFGNGPSATAGGALGHEIAEQTAKQAGGVLNYLGAHSRGVAAENAINGTVRGAQIPGRGLDRSGTGSIVIPFVQGQTSNRVTLNIRGLNVMSVVQ